MKKNELSVSTSGSLKLNNAYSTLIDWKSNDEIVSGSSFNIVLGENTFKNETSGVVLKTVLTPNNSSWFEPKIIQGHTEDSLGFQFYRTGNKNPAGVGDLLEGIYEETLYYEDFGTGRSQEFGISIWVKFNGDQYGRRDNTPELISDQEALFSTKSALNSDYPGVELTFSFLGSSAQFNVNVYADYTDTNNNYQSANNYYTMYETSESEWVNFIMVFYAGSYSVYKNGGIIINQSVVPNFQKWGHNDDLKHLIIGGYNHPVSGLTAFRTRQYFQGAISGLKIFKPSEHSTSNILKLTEAVVKQDYIGDKKIFADRLKYNTDHFEIDGDKKLNIKSTISLPEYSGDVSSTAGQSTLTLATVNTNVGTFGTTVKVPRITIDGKGRLTGCVEQDIVFPSGGTVSYNDLTDTPTLFSGSYSDLTSRPTLFSGSYTDLTSRPTLFSGSYTDLTSRPTLFSGSYTDLTSRPTLFSGSYNDLSNRPTILNYSAGTGITVSETGVIASTSASSTWTNLTNGIKYNNVEIYNGTNDGINLTSGVKIVSGSGGNHGTLHLIKKPNDPLYPNSTALESSGDIILNTQIINQEGTLNIKPSSIYNSILMYADKVNMSGTNETICNRVKTNSINNWITFPTTSRRALITDISMNGYILDLKGINNLMSFTPNSCSFGNYVKFNDLCNNDDYITDYVKYTVGYFDIMNNLNWQYFFIQTYCAKFSKNVWFADGAMLQFTSDSRVKTNINRINKTTALQKIASLQPSTFRYIDIAANNSNISYEYGFIAQEVDSIVPWSVFKGKNTIPNIYRNATYLGYTITLETPLNSTILQELQQKLITYPSGIKLRISTDIEDVFETTVLSVVNSSTLTVEDSADDITIVSNIWVYGYEIDDFQTLNKDALYTLNISATQALNDKVSILENHPVYSGNLNNFALKTDMPDINGIINSCNFLTSHYLPEIVGATSPPVLINGSNMTHYVVFTHSTSTKSITFKYDTLCDILIVGGGGASSNFCGAGAGGNLIYATGLTIPKNTLYNIVVGKGGSSSSINGGSSSVFGEIAYGGLGSITFDGANTSSRSVINNIVNNYRGSVVFNLPETTKIGDINPYNYQTIWNSLQVNLIVWYKLIDNLNDSSVNNKHLTSVITWDTPTPASYNNRYYTSGTTDAYLNYIYNTIPPAPEDCIFGSQFMSVAFFIKGATELTTNEQIIVGSTNWHIRIVRKNLTIISNKLYINFRTDIDNFMQICYFDYDLTTITTNTHIVITVSVIQYELNGQTVNHNVAKLFANGVPIPVLSDMTNIVNGNIYHGSLGTSPLRYNSNANLNFFKYFNANTYFNDMRIYGKELTSNEINMLLLGADNTKFVKTGAGAGIDGDAELDYNGGKSKVLNIRGINEAFSGGGSSYLHYNPTSPLLNDKIGSPSGDIGTIGFGANATSNGLFNNGGDGMVIIKYKVLEPEVNTLNNVYSVINSCNYR